MSAKQKILIAVLIAIAILLAIFFFVRKSSLPGNISSAEQDRMRGEYIAGMKVSKVDGESLVLNNGWILELASDTYIVTRTSRDPEEYRSLISVYKDAQAQGMASGTPPLPYVDKAFAASDIKTGYGIGALLKNKVATGTVSAANIAELVVYPEIIPAPVAIFINTPGTVKAVQNSSILTEEGYSFSFTSATPVKKRVYKIVTKPEDGYTDVQASTSDIKAGRHISVNMRQQPTSSKNIPADQIDHIEIIY